MTEPKRWPVHADNLRMEAIAEARKIVETAQEANQALVKGETVLAMAYLGDVIALAGRIQELLNAARDGREIKDVLGLDEEELT